MESHFLNLDLDSKGSSECSSQTEWLKAESSYSSTAYPKMSQDPFDFSEPSVSSSSTSKAATNSESYSSETESKKTINYQEQLCVQVYQNLSNICKKGLRSANRILLTKKKHKTSNSTSNFKLKVKPGPIHSNSASKFNYNFHKLRRRLSLSLNLLFLFFPSVSSISSACITDFEALQAEPDYVINYGHFWNLCTIRSQNRLTACCDSVDFSSLMAEGCAGQSGSAAASTNAPSVSTAATANAAAAGDTTATGDDAAAAGGDTATGEGGDATAGADGTATADGTAGTAGTGTNGAGSSSSSSSSDSSNTGEEACSTTCMFAEYKRWCVGDDPTGTAGNDAGSYAVEQKIKSLSNAENSKNRVACQVTRRPFKNSIGAFGLTESFCIPESCNSQADLTGLMEHYSTAGKFPPALGSYLDSVVECKTDVAQTVFIVLLVSICVLSFVFMLWYIWMVPAKRRGIKPEGGGPKENVEFRAMELAKRV